MDHFAVFPGDISGKDQFTRTIAACDREQCITVSIVNDEVLELQERFFMNLEPLPDHEERIELVDTVKVLDIIDDDCK